MTDKMGKNEAIEAISVLCEAFPKGSTVHVIVRSVARSGMSRTLSVLAIGPSSVKEGATSVRDWSHYVGLALGRRVKDHAIVVQGCGMDMTFELVYSLAQALYGDGYALTREVI